VRCMSPLAALIRLKFRLHEEFSRGVAIASSLSNSSTPSLTQRAVVTQKSGQPCANLSA
jgi:hypothetical protein